ncbi:MAG: hypothetical protein HXX11_02035 [Desulfuromonadales bacterium]|nr:hypothetical protein [Desulfuromonadales bacterium]
MPSTVENRLHTPATHVASGLPQRQIDQKTPEKGGGSARAGGQPQRFSEDIVTLSTSLTDTAVSVEKKKPSLAVTSGERKALLGSGNPTSTFSIYG